MKLKSDTIAEELVKVLTKKPVVKRFGKQVTMLTSGLLSIHFSGRPDYYCEEYIIMLKLALSVISILLQVMYGFFEISLLVEKKQDEDAGLTEEEIDEKGKKRLKTSFTSGTVALFISVVNYFIAAFE